MNILEQAGLHHYLERTKQHGPIDSNILLGRIIAEYGTRYDVLTQSGIASAVATKTFITKLNQNQRPKTGDWVTFETISGEHKLKLTGVLPRYSELSRKKTGKRLEAQTIAANVDVVYIVESVTTPFDAHRVERFLVVPEVAKARAALILTKTDTLSEAELEAYMQQVTTHFPALTILPTSIITGAGVSALKAEIAPGQTATLIGPSGVGKSSLINILTEGDTLATAAVREGDQKGRHTTTVRELLLMPNGGVIIDTPGMRELQLWGETKTSLNTAFADIETLTTQCEFTNCDHAQSRGCAVQEALSRGTITRARFNSYLKLKQELAHHGSKISYEARLDKNRREKKNAAHTRDTVRRKHGKR
jgi:ribosome biogenesis GTPase